MGEPIHIVVSATNRQPSMSLPTPYFHPVGTIIALSIEDGGKTYRTDYYECQSLKTDDGEEIRRWQRVDSE